MARSRLWRIWPRRRRRKRRPPRAHSALLPAALAVGGAFLATVGWLAGQVYLLRAELAERGAREAAVRLEREAAARVASALRAERTEERLSRQAQALAALRAAVQGDPAVLAERMILPTVRLDLPESTGSGTVIAARLLADGRHEAFILTACHVIEEVVGEEAVGSVSVEFFDGRGEVTRVVQAQVVSCDSSRDLALLSAVVSGPPPSAARLAGRETLARLRTFSPVYTVGCPLGLAPLPSRGEITNTNRWIEGELFWMTNAQMIFGNSGGGVYDAATQELVGVSSRVCAYGRVLPAAVPHLGVIVPVERVTAWLSEAGYGTLIGVDAALASLPASGDVLR